MQWTLRSLFLLTAGVGYSVAGVITFGIATTIASIVILGIAWFVHSAATIDRRRWPRTVTIAGVTVVALYLGTFITFRVFRTFEFSLAPPDDRQHNIVIFSLNPTAQALARHAYYPLISWIPGNCTYPTGKQIELLNHDPFTSEPLSIHW